MATRPTRPSPASDHLAAAIQLDDKEGGGWDMLDASSQDGSMEPL